MAYWVVFSHFFFYSSEAVALILFSGENFLFILYQLPPRSVSERNQPTLLYRIICTLTSIVYYWRKIHVTSPIIGSVGPTRKSMVRCFKDPWSGPPFLYTENESAPDPYLSPPNQMRWTDCQYLRRYSPPSIGLADMWKVIGMDSLMWSL